MLRHLAVSRYVTPLREGGSLPAIIEADDGALYVAKFRGAGQGAKVLLAEVIAGELGRALGLPIPELVLLDLDPAIGRNESHDEIKHLLEASVGLNMGMRYLSEALAFEPKLAEPAVLTAASHIVWFDAFITNVDRTVRNPNLLLWHRDLWLIDHGAALYVQHTWSDYLARARSPFGAIKDHILLPFADNLPEAHDYFRLALTPALIESVVALLPDDWLTDQHFADPATYRAAFVAYLVERLTAAPIFVEEAIRARRAL